MKTVTVTPCTSNPRSPTNLLNERCKRRQHERNWRKTKKESDKLLYKKQGHIYNFLLKKVQSNYFPSLFDNCLDFKSLCHSIDKVLHLSNPSQQIPPAIHSADQFSSFSDKIKTLRLNLPLINANHFSVPDKSPFIIFIV